MASQQQAQKLAHARATRSKNNNYRRLIKTLYSKLEKMGEIYDADIYFPQDLEVLPGCGWACNNPDD
ncbi:uncharacterized protein SETTUDRAFT_28856 [Exserohilum turcica Et28A]|uniref:Uncharacterized protein n=1 Tax=Exserohilum turcicum (strain 28A) TaxID=671987 RepID=R0KCG4_EXST2|nr:uncharacterized protein SETTUDRAFT_28856 [Exserohilum turcica Et28A]EOA85902.1 hypothetical protein SETTUDRAFT_28856 [Exserohilum turcica Et28A]